MAAARPQHRLHLLHTREMGAQPAEDRHFSAERLDVLCPDWRDVRHVSDVQLLLRFTPDSTHVLYVADQEEDGTNELYVAPLDGSAPARKVNAPLVAGGDVSIELSRRSFVEVTSDSRHVLYRADQELDERFELYLAPLDGTGAPRKVSGALVAGGSVLPGFQLAPGDASVIYAADARADDAFELYEARLEDGRVRRLSPPMPPGGDVLVTGSGPQFEIAPDGSRVVYIADQDTEGVLELYETRLERPHRGAPSPGSSATVRTR
jgi:hypothetical protein